MTIFAARRVVPPDLIEPATESAPRMNETGPDAKPPPERFSFCDRVRETFTPEPDPPLKMIPSSRNQSRIECISSSTERMKHAELCWGTPLTPMLNHTGELNDAYWWTMRYLSSSANASRSAALAKYPTSKPARAMVSTTRSTICLTLDSRSGDPSLPRKYLEATTFVAVCDQNFGTSTPFCSKTLPLSPGMAESRRSHSTSSYGWTPSRVKRRSIRRPPAAVLVSRRSAGCRPRPATGSPLRPDRTPRTSAVGWGAGVSMSSEDPEEGRGLSTAGSPNRAVVRCARVTSRGTTQLPTGLPRVPGREPIFPHLGVAVAGGP